MLKKIVSIFFSIFVAFCLVECQTTWQPINNTCTNVNPPTSMNNISGLSFLLYWNGPPISCAFLNVEQDDSNASYTTTFTYTMGNPTTGTKYSSTFDSLLNPNKQGEVQGYYYPNEVPTRVSDIAAFVSQFGFGLVACSFTNGSSVHPIVTIFQFNATENQAVTSSLKSQMTNQNINVTNLTPIQQGSGCDYTVVNFE